MSWTFPGWDGLVYAPGTPAKRLPFEGLTAYAQHPLLRAVEIDRSYYEPLPASIFEDYASRVPDDFRFLVKAHQDCTVVRYPTHDRYGGKRGLLNPRFLDPAYATDAVVAPLVGLGPKLGALVFQFPPQDVGPPRDFSDRLHAFLSQLPKGVPYAVELRNVELLTAEYGAALADVGVYHCHNAWSAMPSPAQQARQLPAATRRKLIVRWLLRAGDSYGDAKDRYAPFDRLCAEDLETRTEIADLLARADQYDVPAFVAINNKAEGCAPESVFRLAEAFAEARERKP
jgi:uncharacterized protein YecE (DUF72 family)